jgi:hypothetical protein
MKVNILVLIILHPQNNLYVSEKYYVTLLYAPDFILNFY